MAFEVFWALLAWGTGVRISWSHLHSRPHFLMWKPKQDTSASCLQAAFKLPKANEALDQHWSNEEIWSLSGSIQQLLSPSSAGMLSILHYS